jgi:hypothetical protein
MDTLTSLKVFRQIVESGSFVSAAERLVRHRPGRCGGTQPGPAVRGRSRH